MLSDAPLHKKDDVSFAQYLPKLENVQRQLQARTPWTFNPYNSVQKWQLIRVAARLSKEAYEKHPASTGIILLAQQDIKATIISPQEANNHQVLFVAIRGSEGIVDWLLKFNSEPTISSYSERVLNGEMRWHKGFLRVTSAMEAKIVKSIEEMRAERPDIRSVLFTGHSAGGAVAQILFAASKSRATECYRATTGLNVACITFGCPPVADSRILPEGSYLGVSVMNEDDPVPLAQEAYIKTLIDVYRLKREPFEAKYDVNSGNLVPTPVLRASGTCVVLKEIDPDAEDSEGFEAIQVPSREIKNRLWGRPAVHDMDVYLKRLDGVALEPGAKDE